MAIGDVRLFQSQNLNHLGKPLKPDGDVGPETEWAMDFVTLCLERRQIVRAAQLFIGLIEDPIGSNTDPAGTLQKWQRLCHAKPGDPWCACFCSFCISAKVRIASAQALGKHFPATSMPMAGDVMWYPVGPVKGHCGIVIGVSASEVMTIEGNLRHAVRCARRLRAGLRFSRTVEDTSGTCPGVIERVPIAQGGTR